MWNIYLSSRLRCESKAESSSVVSDKEANVSDSSCSAVEVIIREQVLTVVNFGVRGTHPLLGLDTPICISCN